MWWSCAVTHLLLHHVAGVHEASGEARPLAADVQVHVLARMLEVDVLRPKLGGLVVGAMWRRVGMRRAVYMETTPEIDVLFLFADGM